MTFNRNSIPDDAAPILGAAESSMPQKPLESRPSDRDLKRQAVLRVATRLFISRGYHRVSMNEIAEGMHVTKPALYKYFKSKDEILVECFRVSNAIAEKDLKMVEKEGGSGLDKLRNFIRRYARLSMVRYSASMIRLDDRELPEPERYEVRSYKRSIDARVRGFISEGIADRSIVPCDVRLAAFAVLGALNWIGQWYRPDGTYTPQQIADEFAEGLIGGLTKSERTNR